METLMLIFWIVVVVAVGFIFWSIKSKKKKPVEKEIFSALLDTEEPKVKPEMPKDNDEGAEEAEEEEYKEE